MKTAYLSINDKISKILVSSKFRILDLQYTDEGYFETFGKRIQMKYILLSFLDTKLFHGARLRQYPFGKFTQFLLDANINGQTNRQNIRKIRKIRKISLFHHLLAYLSFPSFFIRCRQYGRLTQNDTNDIILHSLLLGLLYRIYSFPYFESYLADRSRRLTLFRKQCGIIDITKL